MSHAQTQNIFVPFLEIDYLPLVRSVLAVGDPGKKAHISPSAVVL